MVKFVEKHPLLMIVLVCVGIFLTHLDVLYVNIMEARNFISAREMLHDGNWLLTTMNHVPRYEKPPLPTWLTALSAFLFGIHNLSALRLPAALICIALILTYYKLILEFFKNTKLAFYTALILATSFYIIFSGRNGQWDIFAHGFMVISIYFLLKMLHRSNRWYYAILSGLFFGCAFLSKGPVSPYALWLPFMIAYLAIYKNSPSKRDILPMVLTLVIGVCVGLSWYLYIRIEDPVSYFRITQEETANWSNFNIRPFYYYWSFFTQSGIWTIPSFIALLYPYLKNKVSDRKAYTFSLLWTISSVVLLSVIPEKKSRYLLPVLIPMALNTAFYIEYLIAKFKQLKRTEKLPVYVNFGLIGLIGVLFPIAGLVYFNGTLERFYANFILCACLLFGVGLLILITLKKQQFKNVFLLTVLFTWMILTVGFPLTKALYINPNFNNLSDLKPEVPLYSYGEVTPETLWHFGHTVLDILYSGQLETPSENKFGILVTPENSSEFKRIFAKEYHIELSDTFDLNYTASPQHSAYKDRLKTYYFILEKKQNNHDNQ